MYISSLFLPEQPVPETVVENECPVLTRPVFVCAICVCVRAWYLCVCVCFKSEFNTLFKSYEEVTGEINRCNAHIADMEEREACLVALVHQLYSEVHTMQ